MSRTPLSGKDIVERLGEKARKGELSRGGTKDYEPDGSWLQSMKLDSYFQERRETLQLERIQKSNSLAVGEWIEKIHRVKLIKNMVCEPALILSNLVEHEAIRHSGKFWKNCGYSENGIDYLFPEEALFLIDMGMMEVYRDGLPMSLEEGYDTLLVCTQLAVHQYLAYAHLTRLGYILRRRELRYNETKSTTDSKSAKRSYLQSDKSDESAISEKKQKFSEPDSLSCNITVESLPSCSQMSNVSHIMKNTVNVTCESSGQNTETVVNNKLLENTVLETSELESQDVSQPDPVQTGSSSSSDPAQTGSSSYCDPVQTGSSSSSDPVQTSSISSSYPLQTSSISSNDPVQTGSSSSSDSVQTGSNSSSVYNRGQLNTELSAAFNAKSHRNYFCSVTDFMVKKCHPKEETADRNSAFGQFCENLQDLQSLPKIENSKLEFLRKRSKTMPETSSIKPQSWKEWKSLGESGGWDDVGRLGEPLLDALWGVGEEGVKPLVDPRLTGSTAMVLDQLKIIKNVSSEFSNSDNCEQSSDDLQILYDVYLPASNFKKSSPGKPAVCLTVMRQQDSMPDLDTLRRLYSDCPDKSTLIIAVVDTAEVSFYKFNLVDLPNDYSTT